MLEKITKDVFFVARLFTLFYLSLFLIMDYEKLDFTPVSALSLYFFVSVYIYFFAKTRFLKLLALAFDLTLVPLFIYFSNNFFTLYALSLLITAYSSRKPKVALFLTLEGALLAFYYFQHNPLLLSATLLLFLGLLFTAYNFEYAFTMSKERKRILKLKNDYRLLLKEFSRYEKEKRLFSNLQKLLSLLKESRDPHSYLKALKEAFRLKSIKVVPAKEPEEEVIKDPERGLLVVFVKFDKGYGSVLYELDSPFRLADENLVKTLKEAAQLLSLMVEGFEEKGGESVAITVG